ncbi:DUF3899 domain-containing protein [Aerococcus tenax]|uniref:DUF3899 domain-containing protein n=2 Tax=Aerococcaceae TaxID=186827 RepID=UPI000DD07B8F|nr:DUF3899 domain-containing protein [Aerococcus tenax]KAA9300038.1 DUF3899 domain-containing protein [Aerococcus tenax]
MISTMKKNKGLLLVSILTVLPLFQLLIESSYPWARRLSDSYFILSACFLIPSLAGWILKAGTFDTFQSMWKKYGPRLWKAAPDPSPVSTEDSDKENYLSTHIGPWYRKGLAIGSFFLVLSLVFLLLYYLF